LFSVVFIENIDYAVYLVPRLAVLALYSLSNPEHPPRGFSGRWILMGKVDKVVK